MHVYMCPQVCGYTSGGTCACVFTYTKMPEGGNGNFYNLINFEKKRCQRLIYVFLGMCPSTLFTGAKSVLNLKLIFLAIRLRSPVFISQILGLRVDYRTLLVFFFLISVLGIQILTLMPAQYDSINYQLDKI